MAEILEGKFVRNETNQNSMGGTELMTMALAENANPEFLKEFHIVSSRVRDLKDDKIRVFWAHDLPGDPESEFLKDPYEQSKFHKFVFVSNWQMQGYIDYYKLPWSKCIVMQNAIEPIPQHEKPNPKERINFIYTSTPHRGLNILVPVFEKLAERFGDKIHLDVYSSFELYGWGRRDEAFKPLYEMIEKSPYMTYHGSKPNAEVREALQKAHVLAYPSTWKETSCLCLMEAMSAGLMCVHSNLGALYETSANWTNIYQYNEDLNAHANMFYNILSAVVEYYAAEETAMKLRSMKSYADVYYSWRSRTTEWNALLQSLIASVNDRSLPKKELEAAPMFNYST